MTQSTSSDYSRWQRFGTSLFTRLGPFLNAAAVGSIVSLGVVLFGNIELNLFTALVLPSICGVLGVILSKLFGAGEADAVR